jgi:hypothetical protein
MAKVKIILEKGEQLHKVESDLLKALTSQAQGDLSSEEFTDPAMIDVANTLEQKHKQIYSDMINEICDTLDGDYPGHGY